MSQTIQAEWRKVFPDAEWLPQWTDDPKMIQKLLNEQKVRGVTCSPGVELVEIIAGDEAFDSQVSWYNVLVFLRVQLPLRYVRIICCLLP